MRIKASFKIAILLLFITYRVVCLVRACRMKGRRLTGRRAAKRQSPVA
ncbi:MULTISPECIES: hypothetical protein [Chromohalobacter]|uniref:Uncharacterized protein n=1 Tax=Chromohalobacter moromii TaxID=2860329 RepID=A0A9X2X323_9GAMM|nr:MULTISPECIES: hypothetical protein [Chromohalobacter]MCK2046142.1 hypothetical protein [Chromohalobacter moromii]MCT8505434.1 hypothetical protein [Chromohalobacter moromii]